MCLRDIYNKEAPMLDSLTSRLQREKDRLRLIFLTVLFFGLAAHGYGFLNFTIAHDSMNEFWVFQPSGYYNGTAAQWKIALGRFLHPLYQLIFRGQTTDPWFSGMLAMLWIGLAVWAAASFFDLRQRWLLILTCGIFTVNLSVIALTASYLHDLDANMFAMLTAVLAALLWKRGGWGQLLAVPLLLITLGIYQSMISVYISFVIFQSMLCLLDAREARAVFLAGLRAIGLMAAAGIAYLLLSKAVCAAAGLTLTQQENGLANMLTGGAGMVSLLLSTFLSWFRLFVTEAPRVCTLLNALMFLAGAFLFLRALADRGLPTANKLLLVLLALLLPLGMNAAAFLNNGQVHLLMLYAAWLLYLLLLLLCRRSGKRGLFLFCGLLVALVLFFDVRYANELYTRKDMEAQATLSLMTRVNDRLEQTPGYVPGETEVAILGTPDFSHHPGYEDTYGTTGAVFTSPISTEDFYGAYYSTVLRTPIRLCDAQRREELARQAADLPAFPSQDCITWVEDVLVLRFS